MKPSLCFLGYWISQEKTQEHKKASFLFPYQFTIT
jgi:hypothetical protein